ncbi:MAG: hypothetical protein A2147_07790 [Chloroflexi bacterium RBG_16_57_8]|nr:MAG: hypothetical protein A2147_07790 [Chloroflexi bacterium RBG_16_57_8]
MKKKIFDPIASGKTMTVVCFVSGSGTNYARIVERDPNHNYIVFTNRPGCKATEIARKNGHEVIALSHIPYLKAARERYGPGKVPRNCPERMKYEQDLSRLIEDRTGKQPDIICLAGYDLLSTDWMVDRYYPKILNVHPGDTTSGYVGLHVIPIANALLRGEEALRSTLFIVDKGVDTGPVLAQSRPLNIVQALVDLESKGAKGLSAALQGVLALARTHAVTSHDAFQKAAGGQEKEMMKLVCENLQEALKVAGDWMIYPFAVHDLIGRGRVEVDDRTIYIDGKRMPEYGYRMDKGLHG